jgi:hypothetical protein
MSLILFSFILRIDEPKESILPTTERALTNNNQKNPEHHLISPGNSVSIFLAHLSR